MKKTIVLYEHPAALPDIQNWEENMSARILRTDKQDPIRPVYHLQDEEVRCIPMNDLGTFVPHDMEKDKLVIVGAINNCRKDVLIALLESCHFLED